MLLWDIKPHNKDKQVSQLDYYMSKEGNLYHTVISKSLKPWGGGSVQNVRPLGSVEAHNSNNGVGREGDGREGYIVFC